MLTDLQIRIVSLLAIGFTTHATGKQLMYSLSTVRSEIAKMYQTLGLQKVNQIDRKTVIISWWIQEGAAIHDMEPLSWREALRYQKNDNCHAQDMTPVTGMKQV